MVALPLNPFVAIPGQAYIASQETIDKHGDMLLGYLRAAKAAIGMIEADKDGQETLKMMAPFDFPEAEQELVAGYHTEYSSMSFGMFFLAEYINMVTVSAVATDLFLGGWWFPGIPEAFGWLVFLAKISVLLFFYIWMRWSLPRYRYDQLMAFGWKVLLPVSVLNVIATAAGVLYFGL